MLANFWMESFEISLSLPAHVSQIRGIVNDAAEFAQNSPEPDPSELYTDVIAPV